MILHLYLVGGWGGLLPTPYHVYNAHIILPLNVYTVYNVITVHILSLMLALLTMFTLENISNARLKYYFLTLSLDSFYLSFQPFI